MAHELFHGSPSELSSISGDGVFGGIFGASKEAALSHGGMLHVIVSPRPVTDFELNYEIEGAYDVALELANGDEAMADAIMSKGCEVPESADIEPEDLGEAGWEIQRLRGILASRLGFTSVEMEDEHGTTWLCLPGCEVRAA